MYINIISSTQGGGAEHLVRCLHSYYKKKGYPAKAIYFTGSNQGLDADEQVLNTNPRNPLNILHIRRLLKRYLKQQSADIKVHVHLTWPFFYTTLATIGLKGITLFYTEHSTSNRRRKLPLFRYLERPFYARYSRILCISEGVKASLSRWLGKQLTPKLLTLPNGCYLFELVKRQPLAGRKPRLISVGSLTYKKNFTTLIHALSLNKHLFASFTLLGEGPERNKIEKLIQQKQLQNQVKLLGWADRTTLEKHLKQADIQLIPSLWEGFGLVAVEGMSTGLPIIASDVEGLREVLGNKNPAVTLVAQPQSPDAWAQALQTTTNRLAAQAPATWALSARQQAENFSFERMAESYLKAYHDN